MLTGLCFWEISFYFRPGSILYYTTDAIPLLKNLDLTAFTAILYWFNYDSNDLPPVARYFIFFCWSYGLCTLSGCSTASTAIPIYPIWIFDCDKRIPHTWLYCADRDFILYGCLETWTWLPWRPWWWFLELDYDGIESQATWPTYFHIGISFYPLLHLPLPGARLRPPPTGYFLAYLMA